MAVCALLGATGTAGEAPLTEARAIEAAAERAGRAEDVRKQTSPSPGIPLPAFESAFYKVSRRQVLDQFDRVFVEKALERHAGNVSAAAAEAGIERQYFHKIMKRFGIRGEEFRAKGGAA